MRSSPHRPSTQPQLKECPGCGLFQSIPALAPGMTAQCVRCPTSLHRATAHPLDHSIALTASAFVLLLIVCTTSLMSVQKAGIMHTAGVFSGPSELVNRGMAELAAVVVFVTVIAPFGKLIGELYVLIRLHEATPPAHLRDVFVLTEKLRPWSMVEVFVFGVFVAYTKLGDVVTDRARRRAYSRCWPSPLLSSGPTARSTARRYGTGSIEGDSDRRRR